ncbi:sulfurtransferase [Pseudonocardia sp. Ae168_Ps1]|uniref:sulfurtransferase n=2 Tax=Pseudonocardia TaxID=1847 RepID=UPI0009658C9B|nr:Thiosulfate sulfurtransferase, rhodanese [Pseudonocardia sp. Ae150A_Ps1]OLL88735.1 Thiosulfate sulfurtransferase, rhodanese [Pseudonocardia sp. Ae263_Ps1]OLL91245.1 Thiosulfate sulfurtransferase, rhodanese [Pseudonocardia sp. Ae356_Ps1]
MGRVSGSMITPEDLVGLLAPAGTPGGAAGVLRPVVLDVRWRLTGPPGRDDFEARRVPGAVFVDLDSELAAGPSVPGPGGRHPLPEPGALQRVLRAAGIGEDDRPVVVHDDRDGSVAARAWWLLRWAGLDPARVRVLDGGFAGWESAGGPVAGTAGGADEPEPLPPGDVVVRAGAMPVVDADGAAALARDGVLLDARAAARFRGETEPVDPRAGHVPGARNLPAAANTGPDGRWVGPDVLADRFRAAGAAPGVPVGAYCGSGINACALVLALEVAGLTTADAPAALYPGSWSEWSADPARPVATGDRPWAQER